MPQQQALANQVCHRSGLKVMFQKRLHPVRINNKSMHFIPHKRQDFFVQFPCECIVGAQKAQSDSKNSCNASGACCLMNDCSMTLDTWFLLWTCGTHHHNACCHSQRFLNWLWNETCLHCFEHTNPCNVFCCVLCSLSISQSFSCVVFQSGRGNAWILHILQLCSFLEKQSPLSHPHSKQGLSERFHWLCCEKPHSHLTLWLSHRHSFPPPEARRADKVSTFLKHFMSFSMCCSHKPTQVCPILFQHCLPPCQGEPSGSHGGPSSIVCSHQNKWELKLQM